MDSIVGRDVGKKTIATYTAISDQYLGQGTSMSRSLPPHRLNRVNGGAGRAGRPGEDGREPRGV